MYGSAMLRIGNVLLNSHVRVCSKLYSSPENWVDTNYELMGEHEKRRNEKVVPATISTDWKNSSGWMYPNCGTNTRQMRNATNIIYVRRYLFFVWVWIVWKYFFNCILRVSSAPVELYTTVIICCVRAVWRVLNKKVRWHHSTAEMNESKSFWEKSAI